MQLADSPAVTTTTDRASQTFSGSNQKAYLRLKLALSLNLRRQIFLAVCDDIALRNRIAARLYAELAYPQPKLPTPDLSVATLLHSHDGFSDPAIRIASPSIDRAPTPADDRASLFSAEPPSRLLYPRLVSLNLNLNDPNPMVQIAEWLAQYPPPKGQNQRSRTPGFQILGTERLTRQTAPIQKRFLTSLQQVEHYLSCLESALLLWLPRPWLHAVQQSAPDFWNWHTALFEFEGDPTPAPTLFVRPATAKPATDSQTATTRRSIPNQTTVEVGAQQDTIVEPATPQPLVLPIASANASHDRSVPTSAAKPPSALLAMNEAASTADPAAPTSPASSKENLWDILSHDLALLQTAGDRASDSTQPSLDRTASDQSVLNQFESDQSEHDFLPNPKNAIATDTAPLVTIVTEEAISGDRAITSETDAFTVTPPTVASVDHFARETNTYTAASHQSQAALELADLLLAVAAEETGDHPFIQDSRAIQALQQVEQLHLQDAPNATLLAAYQNLGNLCRDRVEQGNASPQHLLLTIRVHELMLQWLDEASLLWSDLLNDIGNLYWMLSRHELETDEALVYLEKAIASYQQAQQKTNPQTRPNNYAMIQNNLGSAYGDLARFGAPAENLQQSALAYEAALRYRKLADDPARYAATQNNLGTAYWNLAQHEQPVRRLKQSIAAYFEALRYYSPDCEPIHYAMIQNNLGTAYWNLAQQPQANLGVGTANGKAISAADLLQRAIAAYRAALVYRTLDIAPAAYAATQNNLGTAYWQLASLIEQPDQRQELLQQAIVAYKAAIAAVQYLATASTIHAPALSFDPAATHNNLGLAYYQLATDNQRDNSTNRFANLEAALHHHLQALSSWQPQSELYQAVFSYVVQTVRAFHDNFGTKGQTQALSQVPANLLPDVLKQM